MRIAPVELQGRFVKYELDEKRIYGIYIKNRKISNAVTFGLPVVSAAGIFGFKRDNVRPNVGY